MHTISWSDVNHTQDIGLANFREKAVMINGNNIANWVQDPDGRFEVVPASGDGETAELGKFYPSL